MNERTKGKEEGRVMELMKENNETIHFPFHFHKSSDSVAPAGCHALSNESNAIVIESKVFQQYLVYKDRFLGLASIG